MPEPILGADYAQRVKQIVQVGRAELALEVKAKLIELGEAEDEARFYDLMASLLDFLDAESWPFSNGGSA